MMKGSDLDEAPLLQEESQEALAWSPSQPSQSLKLGDLEDSEEHVEETILIPNSTKTTSLARAGKTCIRLHIPSHLYISAAMFKLLRHHLCPVPHSKLPTRP